MAINAIILFHSILSNYNNHLPWKTFIKKCGYHFLGAQLLSFPCVEHLHIQQWKRMFCDFCIGLTLRGSMFESLKILNQRDLHDSSNWYKYFSIYINSLTQWLVRVIIILIILYWKVLSRELLFHVCGKH